jgi:hypothetical protein
MDKEILINILKEKIDDLSFIHLISKLLNENAIGSQMNNFTLSSKISQNCITFPILCNIYLHKLDLEIHKIQKEYLVGRNRRLSNEYNNLTNIFKTNKFKSLINEKQTTITHQIISKRHSLGITRTD